MVSRQKLPKYRLHEASDQAVDETGGRRVYLDKYGSEKSLVEYCRIVAKVESARLEEPEPAPSTIVVGHGDITVAQLAAAFVKHPRA